MVKRYAIVRKGKVENVVNWDPKAQPDWKPEEGCSAVASETLQIGDRHKAAAKKKTAKKPAAKKRKARK